MDYNYENDKKKFLIWLIISGFVILFLSVLVIILAFGKKNHLNNAPISNIGIYQETPTGFQIALSEDSLFLKETQNGSTYIGYTKNGLYDGLGVYNWASGENYLGNWKEGKMNGVGRIVLPSYGTYEGEFVAGKRQGSGSFEFEDGRVFKGTWNGDQPIEGSVFNSDREIMQYLNGKWTTPEGWSVKWEQGLPIIKTEDAVYKRLTNGRFSITLTTGDIYIGTVDDSGFPHGKGSFSWRDGSKYEGDWVHGSMSGNGTYSSSQYSLKGSFKDNKPDGTLSTNFQGKSYSTIWSNGKCNKVEAK